MNRRCTPAPAPHLAPKYRLTDTEGKLTEKRLRALLTRCAEWNDPTERQRLAAALETEEAMPGENNGVVELLRSNSSAKMRKLLMLRLAHCWHYKSDCWQLRPIAPDGEPKPKRSAPNPDPSERYRREIEAHALSARPFTVLHSAHAHVLQLITPRVNTAAHFWAGASSRTQFERAQGVGMNWVRSFGIQGALEVSRWFIGVCEMRLKTLRAWRDSLSADSLRVVAYMADATYNTPSSELEAVRFMLLQSHEATHDAIPRLLQADGKLRPQDVAWIADYDTGHDNIMEMVGSLLAFISMQRLQPLGTFLEAAEAALIGLCYYTREITGALTARVEWTAALADQLGPAAGDKVLARAIIPPMVQRLRLNCRDEHSTRLLALATSVPPAGHPPVGFRVMMSTLL